MFFLTLGTSVPLHLSATLVPIVSKIISPKFIPTRLAPSRPFWDCKSTAFSITTKLFLIFFSISFANYLILREIIF